MISAEFARLVKSQDFIAKIIWAAMCFALFVYAALPYFLFSEESSATNLSESIVPFLVIAALASGIGAMVYMRREFSDERLADLLRDPVSARSTKRDTQRAAADDLVKLTDEESRVFGVVGSRQTPFFIAMALNESIGVYGLAAGFILEDSAIALPFSGAALFLQFLAYPKTELLAERVRRLSLKVPAGSSASIVPR